MLLKQHATLQYNSDNRPYGTVISRYHNNAATTTQHRLAERVKTVCPSLLVSQATSLVIPSQEEYSSADAQRNAARGGSIVRPSCPSSHVFQLTQKATLFHHDCDLCLTTLFHHGSDCCLTITVDCSFVLVILVSSSSLIVDRCFVVSSWSSRIEAVLERTVVM